MKLFLKHILHSPSASLTASIEKQLTGLEPALQIDEAHVVLEYRPEVSPPFRVAFHLVTPGPDVLAESVDHTLRAALTKVFAELEKKIEHRHLRRERRVRGNLQTPAEPRTSRGANGRRAA